jgi:hypothetical protein
MTPIIVTFYAPPIPWRGADYCATRDGYDYLDPMGYGETETEAIAALIEMEELSSLDFQ